jgi:CheY-like chemotaxis protein
MTPNLTPIRNPAQALKRGAPFPTPNQAAVKKKILLVDDDADIRRLNARVLLGAGYLVDTAEDGAVAWHALKLNCYDLLITDNNMPNLSGVELIERLAVARPLLPVILVSGTMPAEELNQRPWLRIEAMLLKPYAVPEFLGKVEAVLGKPTKPTSGLGRGTTEQAKPVPKVGTIFETKNA